MNTRIIVLLTFLLTLNSCYRCYMYFDIKETSSDFSVKMYVRGTGIDDPFNPELRYDLDSSYTIEDIKVIFLDEKKDTIKYEPAYWYSADDSTGHVKQFKDIKREFRVAKSERNLTEFRVTTAYITNTDFTMVVVTDIVDLNNSKYKYINTFNIHSTRSCSWALPIH